MKVYIERPWQGRVFRMFAGSNVSERFCERFDLLNRSEIVWRWSLKKDLSKNISGARRYSFSKFGLWISLLKFSLRNSLPSTFRKLNLSKEVNDPNFENLYLRAPEIFFDKSFFKLHLQTISDRLGRSNRSQNLSETIPTPKRSKYPPPCRCFSISTFM